MTQIKLCGMTRKEDIEAVNILLPDYIGFIFWPKSFRCITKEKALELKRNLNKQIKAVGVFVDADADQVIDLYRCGAIDIIQLHGSEDENYINKIRDNLGRDVIIIKAFKADSVESLNIAYNSSADYILFDPGKGDGMTFGWEILEGFKRPYFLAGGLNSDNVGDAIHQLNPFAVDASSALETDKLKDFVKMTSFVDAVRNA